LQCSAHRHMSGFEASGRPEMTKSDKGRNVPGAGGSHLPTILATQDAEIRRIVVQSQPQANSS
jgi:hypothetical protein